MYKVKKILKDVDYVPIFEYLLLNGYDVEVGRFHNERFALLVRDLLNAEMEK